MLIYSVIFSWRAYMILKPIPESDRPALQLKSYAADALGGHRRHYGLQRKWEGNYLKKACTSCQLLFFKSQYILYCQIVFFLNTGPLVVEVILTINDCVYHSMSLLIEKLIVLISKCDQFTNMCYFFIISNACKEIDN